MTAWSSPTRRSSRARWPLPSPRAAGSTCAPWPMTPRRRAMSASSESTLVAEVVVVLPKHLPARSGVHCGPAAGPEVHPHRAGHDVEARLVVAVVVPAGRGARLGVHHPGPQAGHLERAAAVHPRCRLAVDQRVGRDDPDRLGHGPIMSYAVINSR